MKKLAAAVLLVFTSVVVGFSQIYKAEELVGKENYLFLKQFGSRQLIHEKADKELRILPATPFTEQIKANAINKESVPFVAEYLYLLPKSKLLEGSEKKEITIKDMERVVRSVSKMEGMRYHFSEKHPEGSDVLYKHCYNVANPSSEDPIPDVLEGATDGLETYCYQDDHTYGDTCYKLNYYLKDGILYCSFLSMKSMGMFGLTAVKPNNLRINLIAADCGDSIMLYLSCDVNAQSMFLIDVRGKIEDSMDKRMEAIYKWFMLQFK